MAGKTAPEILAAQMGIAPDEAQRLLGRFAGGMTAELLDRKRLSVDGLGVFSVVHEQAVRQRDSDGTHYRPPRNRVTFTSKPKTSGETATIASARLDLSPDEAQRFAKAFAATLEQLFGSASGLELRGFGSFTVESGQLRFQPEASLDELLNIGYGDLKEIVIPEAASGKRGGEAFAGKMSLKPLTLMLVALLLVAGGWFLYRNFSPGSADVASVPASPAAAPVVESKSAPVRQAEIEPDSLLLGKGRYTVIVATFSSKKGAKQERQRLVALGHRIMFWKVSSGRDRYYRLVTGDFATRSAALDSVKSMPKGLPGHRYIQQASKNVVLYGEQGL